MGVADFSTQQALSGSEDGKVRLWSLVDGQCTRVLEADGHAVLDLQADFYAQRAISSDGCVMSVWDLSDGRRLSKLRGHHGVTKCVAADFGPRQCAVSGGDDGRLVRWDLSNGAPTLISDRNENCGGELALSVIVHS